MNDVLETRLAERRIAPSAELRARITSGVERRNARERIGWLAACAAAVVAICVLRSMSDDEEQRASRAELRIEVSALEELGLPSNEAERLATLWSIARVPRFAPWQDTGALSERWNVTATGAR